MPRYFRLHALLTITSEAVTEHQVRQVVARQVQSAREVSSAMRLNLHGGKDSLKEEYNLSTPAKAVRDLREFMSSPEGHVDPDIDVQVQIEHTVTVDLEDSIDHQRYRKSSKWGSV